MRIPGPADKVSERAADRAVRSLARERPGCHCARGLERTGRVVELFPHGEYVPASGNGMYLLFHGYSTLYAVTPR